MDLDRRQLLRTTAAFLLSGVVMLAAVTVSLKLLDVAPHSFLSILLSFLQELGMAVTIAAIVAFAVESLLTAERLRKLLDVLGPWAEASEGGFKKVIDSREDMFRELFDPILPQAKHRIGIMGICVSLFHQAEKDAEGFLQGNLVDS